MKRIGWTMGFGKGVKRLTRWYRKGKRIAIIGLVHLYIICVCINFTEMTTFYRIPVISYYYSTFLWRLLLFMWSFFYFLWDKRFLFSVFLLLNKIELKLKFIVYLCCTLCKACYRYCYLLYYRLLCSVFKFCLFYV